MKGDLGTSMIFLSANMWDVKMRQAAYEWKKNAGEISAPAAADYFLLQLNVTRGADKIVSTVINPPGTTVEFSRVDSRGRIGESTFSASMINGVKTYKVHIDSPDTVNMLRLKADVEFKALSPGYVVDGPGLFGGIPGGSLHDWQWPIGYPTSSGNILITDRAGEKVFGDSFSGGGYIDHMWGEGQLSDVLDSWYFGRIDLGEKGALIYVWLTAKSGDVKPYGSVFRIRQGQLAVSHEIIGFSASGRRTGAYGLEYNSELVLTLDNGGVVKSRFGNPAVEDWPFQVAGPAVISADMPGDVNVSEQPGLGEYLWLPGIDSDAYKLMFTALSEMPWNY